MPVGSPEKDPPAVRIPPVTSMTRAVIKAIFVNFFMNFHLPVYLCAGLSGSDPPPAEYCRERPEDQPDESQEQQDTNCRHHKRPSHTGNCCRRRRQLKHQGVDQKHNAAYNQADPACQQSDNASDDPHKYT